MTFTNPRREFGGLIPEPPKPTTKISVPWSAEEQRAVRWLSSTARIEELSPTQQKLKSQPAWKILKSLSGSQLADLVARFQRFLGYPPLRIRFKFGDAVRWFPGSIAVRKTPPIGAGVRGSLVRCEANIVGNWNDESFDLRLQARMTASLVGVDDTSCVGNDKCGARVIVESHNHEMWISIAS